MEQGRPSSYDPSYCDAVVEYLGQGHSIMAFAGEIGVTRQTVHNWMNAHPEFFDAVKVGQAKAVQVWEKALLTVALEGGGNATAAIFGLKNRAPEDWRDKTEQEITGKDGGPVLLWGSKSE